MVSNKNEQAEIAHAMPGSERSLAEYWRRAAAQVQPTQRFLWLTLLGVSVFIALGWLSYRFISLQFQQLDEERMALMHGRAVMSRVTNMRDALQSGTMAVLLYVATDDKVYLASFQDMMQKYPELLLQLQDLMKTQSERRDFQQLRSLSDATFKISIEWLQQHQRAAAKYAGPSRDWNSASRDSVEALRQFVAQWRERETAKLLGADQRSIQRAIQARRYALAALWIGGTLLLALGWLLRAYLLRRQQMEGNLRATSALWSGTLESLSQGVALYTLDSRLMFWNPQYLEFHNLTAGQLYPGVPLEQVIRASGRLQGMDIETEIEQARQTAEVVRAGGALSVERQRTDGRIVQIAGRAMGPEYYVETLTDVTAIRRSEQLARDQATRLTAIMDSVSDAIITLNVSGSIESWSDSAQRMFGYTSGEILRRHVSVLLAEPFASARDGYLQRCLNSSEAVLIGQRTELEARHQNGSVFPIDLSLSEMQINGRRVLVAIVRDITERRAIDRMKSEFVATVSHELRTPLTSIAGSLALLAGGAGGVLPSKAERLLDIANRNSHRLTMLINDILELEKADSGKLSLQLQPRTLLPVIQQSIEANRDYGRHFQVGFVLRSDGHEPVVLLDELRLMQVLANLLSNAVKFSPPGAEVLVTVEQHVGVVRVTVHDNGPGIPESFREQMFVRFAQADSSNTRRNSGTGLGLAITKSLIEHHGGQIGYDSGHSAIGAGQGASFWFELPLLAMDNSAAELSTTSLTGTRILVCDDDPDIAELLSKLLQQHGGVVEVVNSAAAAEQALRQQTPDALVVDINLPDSDGLSLIAQLREQEHLRNLPILILSALNCAELDAELLRSLGVISWLRKPIDALALHRVLARLLGPVNH